MLTVWGRRSSSNVQAVMWCAAELGLPVTRRDVGHRYGGNDTPAFLAMNPNGTVPVLQDGEDAPLFESGAIVRYLAGRYGADPFWPADLARRAQVDMWAEWAKLNVILNYTMPIFWRLVRTAPRDRDEAAVEQAISVLARALDIAEVRLARHAYLAGDDLTVADIQLGHVLYRYYDVPLARPDHPALRRYYDGLVARPAYREHVMVSYEELRVT